MHYLISIPNFYILSNILFTEESPTKIEFLLLRDIIVHDNQYFWFYDQRVLMDKSGCWGRRVCAQKDQTQMRQRSLLDKHRLRLTFPALSDIVCGFLQSPWVIQQHPSTTDRTPLPPVLSPPNTSNTPHWALFSQKNSNLILIWWWRDDEQTRSEIDIFMYTTLR